MKLTALLPGLLVASALGTPLERVQHERRDDVRGGAARRAADPDTPVPVRVALKQRNLSRGMDLLMEVSDPDSPLYGQHYSPERVVETFAPPESAAAAVRRWLVGAGVPADSIVTPASRGWVGFRTTVGKLESLLQTSYHLYERRTADGGASHRFLGTDGYSLPAEIAELVDFVHPGVSMAKMVGGGRDGSGVGARAAVAANSIRPKPIFRPLPESEIRLLLPQSPNATVRGCDRRVTPACIRALYSIPPAPRSASPANRLGMFEIDDEYFRQSDLDLFFRKAYPAIPKGTGPKVDLLNWGDKKPDPSGAEGEVSLDLDMVYPIIYPQQIELFQSKTPGGDGFVDQFLDAIDGSFCTKDGGDQPEDGKTPNEMCGAFKPASVYSFSYGNAENAYSVKYLKRQCDEFMKLGLQGTTMVWASGDGGVAGNHGGECMGADDSIFAPIEPAACPYVTSVGATMVEHGKGVPGRGIGKADDIEVVTDQFSPGGGFSNMFPAPAYQKRAVEAFFAHSDPGFPSYRTSDQPHYNKTAPPSKGHGGGDIVDIVDIASGHKKNITGIYNRAGRGFPDISANGLNGVTVFNGEMGTSGGTSQSAPIVAAIFNRLNEERLAAGKKSTIGFANPAIYKNPAMFHDITRGGMRKDSLGACRGKSWDAAKGWDPVTGLGTPNYPAMSKYFGSL